MPPPLHSYTKPKAKGDDDDVDIDFSSEEDSNKGNSRARVGEIRAKYQIEFNNDRKSHSSVTGRKSAKVVEKLPELKNHAVERASLFNATLGSVRTEVAP